MNTVSFRVWTWKNSKNCGDIVCMGSKKSEFFVNPIEWDGVLLSSKYIEQTQLSRIPYKSVQGHDGLRRRVVFCGDPGLLDFIPTPAYRTLIDKNWMNFFLADHSFANSISPLSCTTVHGSFFDSIDIPTNGGRYDEGLTTSGGYWKTQFSDDK